MYDIQLLDSCSFPDRFPPLPFATTNISVHRTYINMHKFDHASGSPHLHSEENSSLPIFDAMRQLQLSKNEASRSSGCDTSIASTLLGPKGETSLYATPQLLQD